LVGIEERKRELGSVGGGGGGEGRRYPGVGKRELRVGGGLRGGWVDRREMAVGGVELWSEGEMGVGERWLGGGVP
jgi:hypothetical protein